MTAAWPRQSAPHVLSSPFTPAGFQVAQAWFVAQHLLLFAALGWALAAEKRPDR